MNFFRVRRDAQEWPRAIEFFNCYDTDSNENGSHFVHTVRTEMPGQLARPVMYNDSTIRHATYVEAILWPSSSQLRMYY